MGVFRNRQPQKRSNEFVNPLVSGEDAAAVGLKSAIPIYELIKSGADARRLRKKLPTKFSRVTLGSPVVRDMARPSFALPQRGPAGSSLAEVVAGQKFGAAYQNAQEANFEMQNEAQKRQQEAANIGIDNQENLTNVQIANQEAQLNSQIDMQDYNRALNRRDVALNALNYYLATDPNQFIQGKDMRRTGRDNFIVQNQHLFTEEEYKDALSRVRSVPPTELTAEEQEERETAVEKSSRGRSGRKLKTRFSYGSR